MALNFNPGWNAPIPRTVARHGEYQAFLDTLTTVLIEQAFSDANSHFADPLVADFIRTAVASSTQVYTIEQGTHQPEDLVHGGFCLHFTGRNSAGLAFHFYIVQNPNGTPKIFEVTYVNANRQIVSCKRT